MRPRCLASYFKTARLLWRASFNSNQTLTPWMQPLFDNFDLIFGSQDATDKPSYWRRPDRQSLC
ncbi:MAG: hypothetical protein MJA27_08620 [Pseudanabaenales cyanobacterium]|nr:hypothetical protein [Pseudanabaenales cyanobacterium]